MKYASLKYKTYNIGDWIQTLAAEQFLPQIDMFIDRDQTNHFQSKEKHLLIMNGWYSHFPKNWPPSPSILPVFTSFHMTPETSLSYKANAEYFKRFGPIGCRDRGTLKYFESWNVAAYLSYCLTLTFPRNAVVPKNGKVAIVDAYDIAIPKSLRKRAVKFQHRVLQSSSNETNRKVAIELLEFYRKEVNLVITTKIHCAMPCMAMGIPVIYFGDKTDYRTNIINEIGGRIYNRTLHKRRHWMLAGGIFDAVDWSPAAVDLGEIPTKLKNDTKAKIEKIVEDQ